jgi:hypothetical protein
MLIRFFAVALFALLLSACGSGDSGPAPAAPSSSTGRPTGLPTGGGRHDAYFFGNARIEGGIYFAQALLARDGTLRLYIAGPDGVASQVAAQFVGSTAIRSDQLTGTGTIIGHGCANRDSHRYCGSTATAEIDGRFSTSSLDAEILVTSDAGNERWMLSFSQHALFYNTLPVANLAGQYVELIADFARSGDTVVNIDRAGRLFFQSPGSGCTGNGILVQRPDSSFNLYDVTLTIAACKPTHGYLNGEFEGIASPAADGWDYGSFLLQILLSTPKAAPSQMAIAMSGRTQF